MTPAAKSDEGVDSGSRPGLYLAGLIPRLIGPVLAVYGFVTPMPAPKR